MKLLETQKINWEYIKPKPIPVQPKLDILLFAVHKKYGYGVKKTKNNCFILDTKLLIFIFILLYFLIKNV
jgi:hypothetical protein